MSFKWILALSLGISTCLVGSPLWAADKKTDDERIQSLFIPAALDAFVAHYNRIQNPQDLAPAFLGQRSAKDLQEMTEALKSWKSLPKVQRQGQKLIFTRDTQYVSLEFLDLQNGKVSINGQNYTFDASAPLMSQVEMIRQKFFSSETTGRHSLFLPEAQAAKLKFPEGTEFKGWGPLAIGIPLGSFFVTPGLERARDMVCQIVVKSPKLVDFLKLEKDGSCKNVLKETDPCRTEDKNVVSYFLKNSDGTYTKWVARLNSDGKVVGIKELLMDAGKKQVLKIPIEYKMTNEELTEVKINSSTVLSRSRLTMAQESQWAKYETVAATLKAAADLCQPGMYDRVLQEATKGTAHPSEYPTPKSGIK